MTANLDGLANDGSTGENDTIKTDIENLMGGAGNDTLTGSSTVPPASPGVTVGANRIDGLGGNDVMVGLAGNDVLDGGAGDDTFDGGVGTDTADFSDATTLVNVDLTVFTAQPTGQGNDTFVPVTPVTGPSTIENVIGSPVGSTITGDAGPNVLTGSSAADIISGGAGNDTISGLGGDDQLSGGADNDTVSGGDGNDTLFGGDGNDVLNGDAGNDTVNGGEGLDTIDGGAGNDPFLFGGNGNDVVSGGPGNDTVSGGAGNDTVYGGSPTLTTLTGNDRVFGDDGADTVIGGDGNDVLSGAGDPGDPWPNCVDPPIPPLPSCAPTFPAGWDAESAAPNNVDTISGNAGDDHEYGGQGNDTLFGGSATLAINDGNDVLNGNDGNDTLNGGDNSSADPNLEELHGGAGDDTLRGGSGDDLLDGGTGTDTADYSLVTAFGGAEIVNLSDTAIGHFPTAADPAIPAFTALSTIAPGGEGTDTIVANAGVSSIENVNGTASNDVLVGDNQNNVLNGNGGADDLFAGAGAGANGVDTLHGGTGNDRLCLQDGQLDAASTGDAGTNLAVKDRLASALPAGGNTLFTDPVATATSVAAFDESLTAGGFTARAPFLKCDALGVHIAHFKGTTGGSRTGPPSISGIQTAATTAATVIRTNRVTAQPATAPAAATSARSALRATVVSVSVVRQGGVRAARSGSRCAGRPGRTCRFSVGMHR